MVINTHLDLFESNNKNSIASIKKLGLIKSEENLDILIGKFYLETSVDLKREIVSSIGRQKNLDTIYKFISKEIFQKNYMDIVYQMYRTCLYKSDEDKRFYEIGEKAINFYKNEVMLKMKSYFLFKKKGKKKLNNSINKRIVEPTLLIGDNRKTLAKVLDKEIQFIFTSPPYYNAREYSDYFSYNQYLEEMYTTLKECFRVLEEGRFIIINVSPIITKRAGREFESIRYPIHFDFHKILERAGFYFIDEIIWIKPDCCVPNRVGGYSQTLRPLSYKPNCVTESLLVYRKNTNFLLDENIKGYINIPKNSSEFERTNCWYITPKSNKHHPAVFPEELCEKVLAYYSFPNDVVLDPFAGSGTFGKSAIKMGRVPVLCEVNKDYLPIIQRNIFYEKV